MLSAGLNETLRFPFLVTDVDGISALTGLGGGSFTKVLIHEDEMSAVPVTVTEIGNGYYCAEFVPDEEGLWYVAVTTPAQDIFASTAVVGEYNLQDAVALLRKAALNRLEINFADQELILYDDDGATVRQRWPLETDGGPPSDRVLTQPGIQTKRKQPLLPT
jgi:hypothetical protein